MAISSPSKLWSARGWSAYGDNDLNIPQQTADLLTLSNAALFAPRNTPSVLLNNPSEYIKNIIEGCSLARGNLARDVVHLRVRPMGLRDWLSVKVWPPSRGRLADLLITTDTRLGSW